MFRQLALSSGIILILIGSLLLLGCSSQSEQGKDYEDNNTVVFSNPPESQRFRGDYGPSFAAQQVIELDHYLTGYKGESPRLYIEYTNISNETVKIDIGIMWLIAHNDIVRQVGQCDIRPPISPGESERASVTVYRRLGNDWEIEKQLTIHPFIFNIKTNEAYAEMLVDDGTSLTLVGPDVKAVVITSQTERRFVVHSGVVVEEKKHKGLYLYSTCLSHP